MIIEFLNGEQLEVNSIYGAPRLVDGVIRDVLKIEVNINNDKSNLERLFKDNPNAFKIYSYSETPDENGGVKSTKTLMAEGYTIFISIDTEEKVIKHPPGRLLPDTKENVRVIMIAQQTYEEYQSSIRSEE